MIKKIAKYFWVSRWQLARYFVVGVSGVVLDLGTLILFKEKLGISPFVAVILNQVIVLSYNFTLNKLWSFKNRALPHKQAARYLILMSFNYLFSVSTMYYFNHILGYDYRLVRLGSIIIMVMWNFLFYKFWIFKEEVEKLEEEIKI